jgi:Tol biopolymer transport system component
MTRFHRQWSLAAAAGTLVFILLGTGCGDAPTATAPDTGGIRALVEITGGEPSDSTFTLTVDSSTKTFAFAANQPLIAGLSPGPHTLTLKVTAPNCTVTGLDRMSITVLPGATADVTFDVECKTTGIEITTHTTGFDSPSSYAVLVNSDSGAPRPAEPNGLLLVSRLKPGPNSVTLTALSDNCHVVGANPITVDVVNRAVTPVAFDVRCVVIERPEKIAYEAQNTMTSAFTIRLVNPDGSGEADLGNGTAPSWSPDGSKLVFRFSATVCTPYDGCFDASHLAVMNADGGNIQALPAGYSPAWAPSGDVIAFVGCCDSSPQLYLTRLDGSQPVRLPIQGVDGAGHPAWSPDGLRIAFECFFAPASNDICVVNKDGTGLVRFWITDSPGQIASWPAWSPDGRAIAFTAATFPTHQIEVMAADGAVLRLLADGAAPAWSRDGAKLVFVGDNGLFEIDADGSNLKRLTTGHHAAPAWRP